MEYKYKVGEEVIFLGTETQEDIEYYGEVGIVNHIDYEDEVYPYMITFENGGCIWCGEDDIKYPSESKEDKFSLSDIESGHLIEFESGILCLALKAKGGIAFIRHDGGAYSLAGEYISLDEQDGDNFDIVKVYGHPDTYNIFPLNTNKRELLWEKEVEAEGVFDAATYIMMEGYDKYMQNRDWVDDLHGKVCGEFYSKYWMEQ